MCDAAVLLPWPSKHFRRLHIYLILLPHWKLIAILFSQSLYRLRRLQAAPRLKVKEVLQYWTFILSTCMISWRIDPESEGSFAILRSLGFKSRENLHQSFVCGILIQEQRRSSVVSEVILIWVKYRVMPRMHCIPAGIKRTKHCNYCQNIHIVV